MPKALLITASVYLAAIGLALLFVPAQFGTDAVPENPPPELLALLRLLGGPFLGIAVLNWTARNLAPGSIRRTILLANTVGFGVVAANDIWGVLTGEARDLAKIFVVVHLAFAVAFGVTLLRTRDSAPGTPEPADP